MSFQVEVLLTSLLLVSGSFGAETFRFANYYGDHMVLQRGDKMSLVWGYVPQCDTITAEMNGVSTSGTCTTDSGLSIWKVMLPAQSAGGPHTIIVSSSKYGKIMLKDVMFGDVWICSGQSNMVFTVQQAFNATEEIAKADSYSDIRLFTVQRVTSATPLAEPPVILQPWSVASQDSVKGGDWQFFSATCWFYAKNIYDRYKIPLGMVSSNWGGTIVEAWSSPDALKKCNITTSKSHEVGAGPNPNEHSVLWNAMMHPFLPMTIKGAIWYQGESNAGNPALYNCTFREMINDWRAKWSATKQTDPLFPFGFVQLAAYGSDNKTVGGFPGIRWSQTASYGYVPNPAMQNVFMVVAMDLGDPTSPYGSIHPRDKEDVGSRLALAGSAIAYGTTGLYYTGPLVKSFGWTPTPGPKSPMSAIITFDNLAPGEKLELRSPYGFEIGCVNAAKSAQNLEGTATGVQDNGVHIWFPNCPEGYEPKYVLYAWRQDPCPAMKCAIYSGGLPSPPFMMAIP